MRTLLAAGGFRWTPLRLGSKLKLWLDERSQSGTGVLDTWGNQAPGGVADLTGSGAARPALGRKVGGRSAPAWVSSDQMVSATNAASMISASAYELWAVFDQTEVPSGTNTGSSFWINGMVIGDASHYFGLHIRSEGGGLYTVQLGHFGSGAVCIVTGIRLDESPTFVHGWFDGSTINLEVNGVAGTPVASGNVTTGSLGAVSIGPGGTHFFVGRLATVLVCNAVCSATERTRMGEYLTAKYGGRYRLFAATLANMWGNRWPDASPSFRSSSAMLVIDTDSPSVGVRAVSTVSAVAEYSDVALIRGAASSHYGTTEEAQLPVQQGLVWDSGPKPIGGSGTRRVFAVGGCLSGFQGTTIEHVYVPVAYAGTTSVATEDSSGTVAMEGWGGMKCRYAAGESTSEDNGFVVTSGVLSSAGGDIAKRAAWQAAVAAYGADKALICLGTNDARSSVADTDFSPALGARIDEVVASGIAAADVYVMSPIRIVASAPTMAAIRTACSTVAAAKGCGFIDGSGTPGTAADLGPDGIHPDPGTPEQEIASLIESNVGTTGKLLVIGDSIMCGSTDPSLFNTARGVIGLLRIGRI